MAFLLGHVGDLAQGQLPFSKYTAPEPLDIDQNGLCGSSAITSSRVNAGSGWSSQTSASRISPSCSNESIFLSGVGLPAAIHARRMVSGDDQPRAHLRRLGNRVKTVFDLVGPLGAGADPAKESAPGDVADKLPGLIYHLPA